MECSIILKDIPDQIWSETFFCVYILPGHHLYVFQQPQHGLFETDWTIDTVNRQGISLMAHWATAMTEKGNTEHKTILLDVQNIKIVYNIGFFKEIRKNRVSLL